MGVRNAERAKEDAERNETLKSAISQEEKWGNSLEPLGK